METQQKLFNELKEIKPVITLQKNKYALEQEKERFIHNMCDFIEPLNFEQIQTIGRPKANFKDVIKSFLIMSYHGFSYRRAESDLREVFRKRLIRTIPPRSTLNDYANKEKTKRLIEKLIQLSALFFTDNEDTAIIDSTWFGLRMYTGGFRKVYDKKNTPMKKVRKLHLICLKNSKIIAVAKATKGTEHDSPHFKNLIKTVLNNGFRINNLLADAGYSGKNNYALCRDLGIFNVFINFKSNSSLKRAKSDIWREKLRMYKEQRQIWNQTYRFRVLVEGVFSAIKRKNLNYLRSKRETSQDVEILLKALVYNLTIIGKYT